MHYILSLFVDEPLCEDMEFVSRDYKVRLLIARFMWIISRWVEKFSLNTTCYNILQAGRVHGGGHGEVYRAYLRSDYESAVPRETTASEDSPETTADSSCQSAERFILKRMFVERGVEVMASGLREVYFGGLLKDSKFIARFFLILSLLTHLCLYSN